MKTCSLSWPGNQVYKHELCIAKPYQSTDSSLDVINSALEIIDSERDLRFMNIYLSAVDRAGHSNGPVGSKTNQAIKEVDAALKRLLKELYNRSLLHKTNIVVVSDHGMTKRRHDCQINLYKIIPALRDLVVWMDDDRPVTSVHVKKGSESKVYDLISEAIVEKKLKLDIYWTSELPRRLRIKKTPRSGQIWLMCREGCTFVREESLKKNDKGTHGYDPDMKSMHGIFVASGPAFRGSVDLASIPLQEDFENETIIGDKIEPKEMEGSGFSGVLKNLNKNFVKIRPKHVKLDRRLQIKKHHRKKLTEAELTLAIKQMNSLLMSSSEKADYEGQNFIKKNSKNVIETPLRGQRISNIEIYPLLCRVLGIHCLPGDYSRFEDSLISQILT